MIFINTATTSEIVIELNRISAENDKLRRALVDAKMSLIILSSVETSNAQAGAALSQSTIKLIELALDVSGSYRRE